MSQLFLRLEAPQYILLHTMTLPSSAGRPVAVLGGGVLGRRVATMWAAGGHDVRIRDPSADQRTAALHYCENNMAQYPGGKHGTVKVFEELAAAVEDAWMVVEAVPEKLALKKDTFAELEKAAPRDCILCTNSSSFKSREMVDGLQLATKKRILNTHYYMPPANVVVELMTDGHTEPDIFPFLADRCRDVGLHPYVARKESTGLIFNRLWAAIKRETLCMLAEGVSTPEEVDALWVEMWQGNGSGPVAMMDSVGLDTVAMIEQHYIDERGLPEEPVRFLQSYLDEGRLGAKSGKGGLYPAGATTKAAGEARGCHDNMHAPLLYFLDLGLSSPSNPFTSGRILVGAADGRALREVVTGLTMPDGIAISLKAGRIFWTSMGNPASNDGCLFSCNLDGSDVREIVARGKVHTPKQLCLDHANAKLYFCDREGMRVWRCGFDGADQELLVQTGDWTRDAERDDQTRWCVGVAVSPAAGKFFWTQKGASKGSQGRIFSAAMEMPARTTAAKRRDVECLFQRLPEPIDLEIDEASNVLYWTDRGELPFGNTVNRVDLANVKPVKGNAASLPGRDYDIISRGLHEAIGLSLDLTNRHVYVADMGGSVYMTDMDGGNRKKLYDDCGSFTGITHVHV